MRVARLLLLAATAFAAVAVAAAPASAIEAAGKIDLSKVKAQKEVKDVILEPGARIASASKVVGRVALADSQGQTITIDSTVPGFDLNQVASVLNSTYHKTEIIKVKIHVVTLADMATICGSSQALACYRPMSGGYGELWFAADDTDWIHSLVHEYGHHVDNQYANVAQLRSYGIGTGCTIDSDGTRNWFFERLSGANTTDADRFSCLAGDWEHLLPELFAEDFVVFNGIIGWQLSSAQPPNNTQLNAMKYDFEHKIQKQTRHSTRTIRKKRFKWIQVKTVAWNWARVKVSGRRGTNFDIAIYPSSSNELWDSSTASGRFETLITALPPGSWDVGVYARKKTGRANIEIKTF